jgi:hypothetical protein
MQRNFRFSEGDQTPYVSFESGLAKTYLDGYALELELDPNYKGLVGLENYIESGSERPVELPIHLKVLNPMGEVVEAPAPFWGRFLAKLTNQGSQLNFSWIPNPI